MPLTHEPTKQTNQKYLVTYDFYDLDESISINNHLYHDKDDLVRKYLAKKKLRLIIYPKDVEMIFGKGPRFARNLLQTIREAIGKSRGMPLTFTDFCQYTGLEQETVMEFIMES